MGPFEGAVSVAARVSTKIRQVVKRRVKVVAALTSAIILAGTMIYSPSVNAAIAHRTSSSGSNSTGSTSLTIPAPTGLQVGELMVASVAKRTTGAFTAPSGWTLVNSVTAANSSVMQSVYYKIAASGDTAASSFTFNFATSGKATGGISVFTGFDPYDPINTSNTLTAANPLNTNMQAATITTTVPNAYVVSSTSQATGATFSNTSETFLFNLQSAGGGSAGTKVTTGSIGKLQSAQGSTTGSSMQTTGGSVSYVNNTVAINPAPVVSQSKYRFFANTDSTTAGTPLAAADTGASVSKETAFRLRLNLGVASGEGKMTAVAGRTFKLQYASRGADGVCDATFTGESYADVTSTTEVQFFNNPTPVDGATYVSSANDPTRGLTNTLQYYEEAAPMNVRIETPANQDAHWDVALNTSSSSVAGGYYCLRVVNSDGSPLNGTYSVVPQVYVLPPVITQSNYRWYANADSATPGAPLVAQNTATTVVPSTQFRLRQRLAIDSAQLSASGATFKLQYAEKAGTCSASFGGTPMFVNQPATMTQTRFAGSASLSGSSPAGWQNVANLYADDNVLASAIATNIGPILTNTIFLSNFGFSIPSGATVNGVVIRGDTDSSVSGGFDNEVFINSPAGSTPNLAASTQWKDVMQWGSATNVQGSSWTGASVNDPSMRVDINAYVNFDSAISLDYVSATVHYVAAASGEIAFYDNPTPVHGATISSSNDPTGRTTVYQTYNETDPYTNSVGAIASGSDGLWDFSLTSTAAANGKTYCFRTVKADGTPLDTYSAYPEITFSSGSTGPTLDQQVRGGASVVNGTKSPLTF